MYTNRQHYIVLVKIRLIKKMYKMENIHQERKQVENKTKSPVFCNLIFLVLINWYAFIFMVQYQWVNFYFSKFHEPSGQIINSFQLTALNIYELGHVTLSMIS